MSHVHESPSVMILPLLVLATGAILSGSLFYGGFVGSAYDTHGKSHHNHDHGAIVQPYDISPAAGEEDHHTDHHENSEGEDNHDDHDAHKKLSKPSINLWSRDYFWHNALFVRAENDTVEAAHSVPYWVKKLPLVTGLLGIFFAYLIYFVKPDSAAIFVRIFKPFHTLFFNKWFFDQIYNVLFIKTALIFGRLFWSSDKNVIDGVGPDGVAGFSNRFANNISKFQTGFVYQYALVMIIALICIISWFVFKADPSFYMPADMQPKSPMIREGGL